MGQVWYLPAAREDLFDIWRYIAEESHDPAIADRLIDQLHAKAGLFASQPEVGELRQDLANGLRCFIVGRYVVFYVTIESGIEIVQVIHGSRDVPAHFRRPPA